MAHRIGIVASHCPNTRHFVGRETNTDPRAKNQNQGSGSTPEMRRLGPAGHRPPSGTSSPPARGAEHPSQHLATYEGSAHAGAYAGYNDAYRTRRIKERACPLGSMLRMRLSGNIWPMCAVSSSPFMKAPSCPWRGEAVLRFKKLYDVETQARFLPAAERVALRQEHAKPIFDGLEV